MGELIVLLAQAGNVLHSAAVTAVVVAGVGVGLVVVGVAGLLVSRRGGEGAS